MLSKKATLLLLLGNANAIANNEAQNEFAKEISDLEHENTNVQLKEKQPIMSMVQKSYSLGQKYLNEIPLGDYADNKQHQQALAGRKHHKHRHSIQENIEKELINNFERQEPVEPARHFIQQRSRQGAYAREGAHAQAHAQAHARQRVQARDSEVVDNGGHQIIYSRNPINQNEDSYRNQHQPYIKQVRRDERGHIHDQNQQQQEQNSWDNFQPDPRQPLYSRESVANPRHEERFVIPKQVQRPTRLDRVQHTGHHSHSAGQAYPEAGAASSDLEQALKYRDVDKKEIKSALEIKLDKFDKIDDKYADFAKKLKENQPKIEKDANIAKSEHIDEKLQERIDRFHYLRDQVMRYSNEIEAAVSALHAERIVSESGRWEIPQDNYQHQTPLSGNQPRVVVQQPMHYHQQARKQYKKPKSFDVGKPLYGESGHSAPQAAERELKEAATAIYKAAEESQKNEGQQSEQEYQTAVRQANPPQAQPTTSKVAKPVLPTASPAPPMEQEPNPAPPQEAIVKKLPETEKLMNDIVQAQAPKAAPIVEAPKAIVETQAKPAPAAPVATQPVKKPEVPKEAPIANAAPKRTLKTEAKPVATPKKAPESTWQTSIDKPEKAVIEEKKDKNIEIDESKASQGTPALVSTVTEGNKPEADLETARALTAEKEQVKSVIEEYDQKINEIKNPPFSKENEELKKTNGQVAVSFSTAGDITLAAKTPKKESVTKSEEARSLYSDADLNEVVAHANDAEEPYALTQKKEKEAKQHHHHHKKHHHKKHHHHHHHSKDENAEVKK